MTCNTEKTHWKKVVSDPNYIGEGDFQPGQEIVVTIDRVVSHETVPTAEGKSDKAVVHFKEKYKPMILNVARSKSITKVAGSPYFEDWCKDTVVCRTRNTSVRRSRKRSQSSSL